VPRLEDLQDRQQDQVNLDIVPTVVQIHVVVHLLDLQALVLHDHLEVDLVGGHQAVDALLVVADHQVVDALPVVEDNNYNIRHEKTIDNKRTFPECAF
jgi:hypothetical protein